MKKNRAQFKKKGSIRTILIVWFIIFSVVPLAFMAWYSLFKFEKAIDHELVQRLKSNNREFSIMIADYYNSVLESSERNTKDPHLIYNISISDGRSIADLFAEQIKKTILSAISFYDREGRLIVSIYKDEKLNVRIMYPTEHKVLLNENYLSHLRDKSNLGLIDYPNGKSLALILFSKVVSIRGKVVGYIEQNIDLKSSFLQKIKNKLKADIILMKENGQVVVGSQKSFESISLDFGEELIRQANLEKSVSADFDQQAYGIVTDPVHWDKSHFYVATAAVKKDTGVLIRNLSFAFLSMITIVVLLLIVTIFIGTNLIVKPINDLISGLKAFEKSESLVQLPISNSTEIGVLTNAFNEMSLKIFQAKKDLKNKIKELETANEEINETQTKLVHSAKMTSLGQLVAGVAHELNNPIGFIYSNTAHLKDYSEKLFRIIDETEKNPAKFKIIKNELDYDYIKMDLPRLIKSCQDGAQRTRDIVLGLRNFSRLDEAQLKEIDICNEIDNTLDLLKGEIKNRIQIHKQYEPVSKIQCYASQINQVLMNILSNAVQAISDQGQIWITVLPLKAGAGSSGRVQISIQDSGAGMEPKVMEKIFEPFYTTKNIGQGTGLGLSISYGIIENHGGEIHVRSQKGVGTEFVITIPVVQPKGKRV